MGYHLLLQVLATLNFMGKRLDTVTFHTKTIDDFQQAVAHIDAAATRKISSVKTATAPPLLRRSTSGPNAAFPPVHLKPSKNLDLPPALQDALRHAGVSFNHDSTEALRKSLINIQLERDEKLKHHYSSTSSSTHDRLAERFSQADGDLQSIMDALYIHTPYSSVHLLNPKLEVDAKRIERELQDADHELLNAETNELSLSDPKVRAFISKYGK